MKFLVSTRAARSIRPSASTTTRAFCSGSAGHRRSNSHPGGYPPFLEVPCPPEAACLYMSDYYTVTGHVSNIGKLGGACTFDRAWRGAGADGSNLLFEKTQALRRERRYQRETVVFNHIEPNSTCSHLVVTLRSYPQSTLLAFCYRHDRS